MSGFDFSKVWLICTSLKRGSTASMNPCASSFVCIAKMFHDFLLKGGRYNFVFSFLDGESMLGGKHGEKRVGYTDKQTQKHHLQFSRKDFSVLMCSAVQQQM